MPIITLTITSFLPILLAFAGFTSAMGVILIWLMDMLGELDDQATAAPVIHTSVWPTSTLSPEEELLQEWEAEMSGWMEVEQALSGPALARPRPRVAPRVYVEVVEWASPHNGRTPAIRHLAGAIDLSLCEGLISC